jgi:hypothetical protein
MYRLREVDTSKKLCRRSKWGQFRLAGGFTLLKGIRTERNFGAGESK